MVSVSTTHLVLFIASIAVAASVAGAFTAESSRLSETLSDVGLDTSDAVDADIEIVTDPGGQVFNPDTGTVTVHVQNLGETTLPHDVEDVDVFVDGVFQPSGDLTGTLEDGATDWSADEVLRIEIDQPSLAVGDHRVKVVVDGDSDTFEFYRSSCGMASNVLVYVDGGTDRLHWIDDSGVITDLGVDRIEAIGPARDFDCDGLLEASYIKGSGSSNFEFHHVRIVDENGEVQTLHTYDQNDNSIVPTRLGVGDLDEDSVMDVVFPEPTDSPSHQLYRAEVNDPPQLIGSGYESLGVGGLGDMNGDGDVDLVYLDIGENLVYLENQSEVDTTADAEDDNSIGSPLDFDGDGEVRVPIELQSSPSTIALVDANGNIESLGGNTDRASGSLATFDWTGDGTADVVWANENDNHYLYVIELDGTETRLQDEDGNPVEATAMGVAA